MASYLFRAVNENAVAGFETNEKGIVVFAAPILFKQIMGLSTAQALEVLERKGWTVEEYSER
jgi:hypothetical protein